MSKKQINILKDVNSDVYTYNIIYKNIQTNDEFDDFMINNLYKSDLSKINLDKYRDYIFEIIDNSDYVFMELLTEKEIAYYKSKLKYKFYDEINISDWQNPIGTNYLFDIKRLEEKKVIKDNLKFNLSDDCREPIIVNTDKEYILNDDNISFRNDYGFIKGNFLQVFLLKYDGYIYDYRDKETRDEQIKRYLKK